MQNLQIHLEHLTRVEGHGDIVVDVREGKLVESKLHIVEAPRFFESFLRGHYWYQAPEITSRICGICSTSHPFAYTRAVEDVFPGMYVKVGFVAGSQPALVVPLSAVVTSRYVTGPDLLPRFNGFMAAKITGDASPGFSSGQTIST